MAIFKLSSILKKLERLGSFNCIFENNSLKALFGQNMKELKIFETVAEFSIFTETGSKELLSFN